MASEGLAFFWAMAPIAVKYAGRGHLHAAVAQAHLLVRGYDRLWRAAFRPELLLADPTSDNTPFDEAFEATLPRPRPVLDIDTVLDDILVLCSAVEGLHDDLNALGVSVPRTLPRAVQSLAGIARLAGGVPFAETSGWR